MTIKTLPHQNLISDDSQFQYSYKVLETSFSDGYDQAAPEGINNEVITWSIQYKNLTPEFFNELMTFIRSLKGAEIVYATIPGDASQKTWRLVKDSLSVSTTAISRHDATKIIRSISFSLRTTSAIS